YRSGAAVSHRCHGVGVGEAVHVGSEGISLGRRSSPMSAEIAGSKFSQQNDMSAILTAVVALLLSAGFVYWACEYFVNGVQWCGRKAGISQTAVGTVLAAFGTALPESVVTFVAVVFGHNAAARDIGVGAALGGPLVLATIAYPIVGIMLLIT